MFLTIILTGLMITLSGVGLELGSAVIRAHCFNHSYSYPMGYVLYFFQLYYMIISINQVWKVFLWWDSFIASNKWVFLHIYKNKQ